MRSSLSPDVSWGEFSPSSSSFFKALGMLMYPVSTVLSFFWCFTLEPYHLAHVTWICTSRRRCFFARFTRSGGKVGGKFSATSGVEPGGVWHRAPDTCPLPLCGFCSPRRHELGGNDRPWPTAWRSVEDPRDHECEGSTPSASSSVRGQSRISQAVALLTPSRTSPVC